jgi:ABC-type dipeptide/oligopeptide/nickel transport system permease component
MIRYLIRRLLAMIPLIVFVTSMTFILGQYGAGDLAAYLTIQQSGGILDMGKYYEMRATLRLDDPVIVRYGRWLWNALHGDLGRAWTRIGQPGVTYLIKKAIPVSFQLGIAALVLLIVIGVPLGVLAAVAHNTVIDYFLVSLATIISSIPGFVLGPIAMIVLVAQLHILPRVGLGWHGLFSVDTLLPALVLAAGPILGIVRYTRFSVLDVLSQDYVRAARAQGLTEWMVITKHVIKNAMTPVLTVLGMTAAGLVSGSIFVERIFNLQGFGTLAGAAIEGGDLQTSTGVLLVSAFVVMFANLGVDMMYGLLDPRVKLGK